MVFGYRALIVFILINRGLESIKWIGKKLKQNENIHKLNVDDSKSLQ